MKSSALTAGIRHLRTVMASQDRRDDSDEQLLHAFIAQHDDSAFAALVRRYDPLVQGVCRRVLHHAQDAEDAFQATFLLLARNAAKLRNKTALASWLHGAAYRLALTAKRAAARRRKHESQATARPPVDPAEELSWSEVRVLLDEEIARLQETYRSVFILCCLENVSREEAARRLGLKEGTVSSRLAAARKRLAKRLAHRGVELTAALAACTLATQSVPALSPVLLATTIKASLGERTMVLVSASVAELMRDAAVVATLSKTKIVTAVLLAACVLSGAGAWVCRTPAPPQATEQPTKPPKSAVASKPKRDKDAVVMVHGRVLLPDGKPAANATIICRQLSDEQAVSKDTVLTTTGADGRFEVEHRDSTILIASASGFAPDWRGGRDFKGGDLTLTLAERTTVRGRLISLEGKPVAGARVKVLAVKVPIRGNLNAVKDAFRLNPEWTWQAMPKGLSNPIPGSTAEVKAGTDGRFELEGFGKNRVLNLRIEADGIVSDKLHVILADDFDPKSVLPRPRERSYSRSANPSPTVYGLRFTHAVRPCQVITGTVTEEATGKPVSGVKIVGTAGSLHIYFANAEWHDGVECLTDRDGRYRLNGLPKAKQRHLHVQAGAAPYLDRLIDATDDVPTSIPVRVDIKLRKAATIEGRLIDKATGKGVRGEAFYLLLENDNVKRFLADNPLYGWENSVRPTGIYARSDNDGHFKLRVPPVPGVILARADAMRDPAARYASIHVAEADRKYLRKPRKEEGMIHFGPRDNQGEYFDTHVLIHPLRWENGYALVHPKNMEETVNVVIGFDPGRTIRGKIVGPDGRPLTGVEVAGVQATDEHAPTAFRTDAFTIGALDPSRPRTVYFRHAAKNLIGSIALRGDETEMPIVKMQPASTVVGRVLDAAGKPVAGMEVSIMFAEKEPDDRIRQNHLCHWDKPITDADGRFRLEGLFPDLEFAVFAGRPGHRSGAISYEGVTLKAGEVRDLGERREQSQR